MEVKQIRNIRNLSSVKGLDLGLLETLVLMAMFDKEGREKALELIQLRYPCITSGFSGDNQVFLRLKFCNILGTTVYLGDVPKEYLNKKALSFNFY